MSLQEAGLGHLSLGSSLLCCAACLIHADNCVDTQTDTFVIWSGPGLVLHGLIQHCSAPAVVLNVSVHPAVLGQSYNIKKLINWGLQSAKSGGPTSLPFSLTLLLALTHA